MTFVTGVPVGMKCHDSLIYMAAGSSIEALDFRTMRTAFRISTNQEKMHSFDILPSKFLACTGGVGRLRFFPEYYNIVSSYAFYTPHLSLENFKCLFQHVIDCGMIFLFYHYRRALANIHSKYHGIECTVFIN